jgi:hypothetical protein
LQALALLTAGLALTAIYFAYQVDEPHFKLYLIEDEFARCLDGTKPVFVKMQQRDFTMHQDLEMELTNS